MIVFTIVDKDNNVETLKTSRTKLTVGGSYTDDITLLGQGTSPEYGTFEIAGDEVVYTDNGFGTLVNNRKIMGDSVPVTQEDRIVIGSFMITYALEREEIISVLDPEPSKSRLIRREPFHLPMPEESENRSFSPHEAVPSEVPSSMRSTESQTVKAPAAGTYRTSSIPVAGATRSLTKLNKLRHPDLQKSAVSF